VNQSDALHHGTAIEYDRVGLNAARLGLPVLLGVINFLKHRLSIVDRVQICIFLN
jgi:hypothetical protein